MGEEIFERLAPVRRRQRIETALRIATLGIFASAAVLAGAAVWRLASGQSVDPWIVVLLLLAGPLAGLVIASLRRSEWRRAAHAVDRHYGLKDRTATAVTFVTRRNDGVFHRLQVDDARRHTARVRGSEVVPIRMPRSMFVGVGLLALSLALFALPLSEPPAIAMPTQPDDYILAEAEYLAERIDALEEQSRGEEFPEIDQLIEELRELAQEMTEPGVDQREALAKLSEMQAAIAAQQAEYNVGLVDAQLEALGDALVVAASLEAAGAALQEAEFDKAAKELENLEQIDLNRNEKKALDENLKKVVKSSGNSGLGQLSDAAGTLREGIVSGDSNKTRLGAKHLGRYASRHGKRRRLKRILDGELAALGECKGRCESDSTRRGRDPRQSLSPTDSWGLASNGATGQRTELNSHRDTMEITGIAGDGPSDVETTHSPEGRQTAGRAYRERYQEYRKLSEAVLASEPLPLGQRQAIRRYFELIRPANDELAPITGEVEAEE